jgi:matrixin
MAKFAQLIAVMKRLAAGVCVSVFLAGVLVPCAASGTTFVLANPTQLQEASDAVVVGRVRAVRGVLADATRLQTHVTLSVERAIKGAAASELTVVEPGGQVGNQARWVHGVPAFTVGERVLLFLRRNARNELETTFLAMGKFSIVERDGTEMAVRNLGEARVLRAQDGRLQGESPVSETPLEELLQTLQAAAGNEVSEELQTPPPSSPSDGTRWQENFTFAGPPIARWFSADDGAPIAYRISTNSDAALGPDASVAAVDAALAAWSTTSCASLHLVDGGRAPAAKFGLCDGVTQISFDDPDDEIPDPIDCSGVLAVGGFCTDNSSIESFNGTIAYRISEGDVLVNNGFAACPFWTETNLAEVLTHEVGHTIGLGHSSEDPRETDPTLRDATMYYAAHFDGRGATLRSDDVAAVCALYPTGQSGIVTLRRFAIVSNPALPEPSDRLVVDGVLTMEAGHFNPYTDTLIIDVHAAGASAFRIAVPAGGWRMNATGSRLLYRGAIGTGMASILLSMHDPAQTRFSVRARGIDLSAARADPLVISVALGSANATEAVPPLRVTAGSRVFP